MTTNNSWNSSETNRCSTNRQNDEILAEIVVRLCLVVLGTAFNALVCLTFWRNPRLVSSSTLLLWNLSAADLVMSLLSIPASLLVSFGQLQVQNKCALALVSQQVPWSTGLIIATFTASIIDLVVMSLDRCFMIRLPFTYKLYATAKRIKFVIAFIWVVASVCFICMTARAISQDFFTKAAFSMLTLCYFVIIISYLFVFFGIRKQKRTIASNRVDSVATRQHITEKELAKTISIIIVVFSVSWAPLGYTMIRYSNFETFANSNALIHWAATVGMTTAVVNPLIYFGRKKAYREAALAVLKIPPSL